MTAIKTKVAMLSVISNTTLVVLKLIVGICICSVSVISEAIHSGVDLLAAMIAYYAVRTSETPADGEHPFGHGKIENISGAVEAVLIFLAAGWIIYEAVHKLLNPHSPLEQVGWGIAVMCFSSAVNYFVSRQLFRVGKATDSPALIADAWHLRTDVWTSLGVMAGLGLIGVSETIFPGRHFHWVDPVAAIAVAMLIIRAAYELTLKAGRDLLDATLPLEEDAWIRSYLNALGPRAHGFHRFRTRKSGSTRFVEFHLFVDPQMTVQDSHNITDEITRDVRSQLPGTDVTIHIEPFDRNRSKSGQTI
ncbi:MAG: cation diffusion facilitator family transporter [Candidatus Sumerlaeota bacterium]|nr:cation diffusion facilitator family transporter [Candidatus Sumerlaeota bacterium]